MLKNIFYPTQNRKSVSKFKCYNSDDKNYDDYGRQNISHIWFNPFADFDTLAGIDFFHKVFKTPSTLAYAEKQSPERTERKQAVRNDKVFEVEN